MNSLNHLRFGVISFFRRNKYSDPLFSRFVLLAGEKEDLFGSSGVSDHSYRVALVSLFGRKSPFCLLGLC